MKHKFFLFLIVSVQIATVFAQVLCNNGLFNFCDLKKPSSEGYTISLGEYDYIINVAGPIERSVEDCPGISNHSVAIQKYHGRHQCYSLADLNTQNVFLINTVDPTKGLKLVYRGGVEGRSISITIPCDPNSDSSPSLEKVTEPYKLSYNFEFKPHKAGCPKTSSTSLPYTNDLTISPSTYQVFRVKAESTMVSLKIDFSFGENSAIEKRSVSEDQRADGTRLDARAFEYTGNNVYIYTKRGTIPTTSSYEYSTFITKDQIEHRSLLIRGKPYLDSGDIYIALYGGSRLSHSVMVHLEVVPQNCLNCNGRGALDCAAQVCHCETPYVYKDCSGELKNITSGKPLTSEKVPSSYWKVYRLERKPEEIYLTAIVESTQNQNQAPVVLIAQGALPTVNNFLASDGYERNRMSSAGNPYRANGVKERHLTVELREDDDLIIYTALFGGETLYEGSDGVIDQTKATDFQYSVVVEAFACKNNCTSPTNGRCNPDTHKCHCHSGYAGKSCSISTKPLSDFSVKTFDIKPGTIEYFEYVTRSDEFANISIFSQDVNDPLQDVMIYVGDGYVPELDRYLVSSRNLKIDEEFVGEIEVEEGDQEEEGETTTGGADSLEDLSYNVQLPPRKSKVKYFIGILNRDPVSHSIILKINVINYKGGLGGTGVFFLVVIMLSLGIATGIGLTLYQDLVLFKISVLTSKLPFKIPFLSSRVPSYNPSSHYSNFTHQQQQQDDDDNLFEGHDDSSDDPAFD